MDIASLVEVKRNPKIPDIAPGDTVRVSTRIVEGGKERIQVFQGVVLKMKRGGVGASFTVRHVAFGIGVERTFPLYSPLVEKVEVVRQGKVRRARLYYLRGLSGKAVRRKIKRVERKTRQVGEELLEAAPEEVMEPEEVMTEEALEAAVAEKAAAVVEGKAAEAAPVAEAVTEAPAAEEEAEPAAEKVAEPAAAEAPGEEKPEDKAAA
ncbi:MAG: 50S ribosomal protein L19 [Chloroflexi bacterium RBG_16_60_22]|nr:MAG: 50S ribosomal protein L19 [Chloroflexi bacterium RBG_16_60_22]